MRARGFTLIEVLVAGAILALVAGLTWASFQQTFHAKQTIEASAERYHSVRVALERLSRELSMAYLSSNDDTTQQERRTFFIGKHKSEIDELRFTMFGHQRVYADSDESDTTQVMWYGARDRETDQLNLVRRETRRLSNDKPESSPGSADIMCTGVVSLHYEYKDAREKDDMREDWTTAAIDGQAGRLPTKVKITLTVKDERDVEIPFTTTVRIMMQEPLDTAYRK